MIDELVRELKSIALEKYPAARSFTVSLNIRAFGADVIVYGAHCGWFVGDEQFSFPMWSRANYGVALRDSLAPPFDPIFMGA